MVLTIVAKTIAGIVQVRKHTPKTEQRNVNIMETAKTIA